MGRILALLYVPPNCRGFLLYRDDNEAVCKLLASVNCVLRENIGAAAAGARASEEAVNVDCRRVLGVEVVAVQRDVYYTHLTLTTIRKVLKMKYDHLIKKKR